MNDVRDPDRAALHALLLRHEGLRLHPYVDTVGKITIGIGRNLTDVGISAVEADVLWSNDVDAVIHGLLLRAPAFVTLDPPRQRALVDLGFNMGVGGLLTFRKMWTALEAKDFSQAAAEVKNSHLPAQVGQRAYDVAAMIETGKDLA